MRIIHALPIVLTGCILFPFPPHPGPGPGPMDAGEIWTADRVEGVVSIIDSGTNTRVATLTLPDNGEPMYVNHSQTYNVVFVGDRANDRVVAFDPDTRMYLGSVPAGAGVFHQWLNPTGDQLWVNNDIDLTTTVIDVSTGDTLATIDMPADLAAMPGSPKPHDVLVSPDEDAAFVTYLGFEGDNDYIVRFDATTFDETHRLAVGKDPHLSATGANDVVYVPCQNTDEVLVLERDDLSLAAAIDLPGAHGVTVSPDGDRVYVTNLPGAGAEAIWVIDTSTNTLITSMGIDAPMVGSPHNLAVNPAGDTLYLTHSGGTSTLTTAWDLTSGTPTLDTNVTVGLNPFGLGAVSR